MPARPNDASVVAVFDDDEDTINMLRVWFEGSGVRCVTAAVRDFRRGREDLAAFLSKHRPDVLVFDLGVPYARNWDVLRVVRMLPEFSDLPVVVTTTNKAVVEKLLGPERVFDVVGKPYDLEALTAVVRRAMG